VQLFVYDLSNGLARSLSPQLVGRVIEGIWHTSVVVYGTEYYYGQGILQAAPGTTPHGQPVQRLDMGNTEIPQGLFEEFVVSLGTERYTAANYHLLDHNCNHFTSEAVQFLTGQNIPTHISDLPREFMATQFGQALRPMLEANFGPSALASPQAQSALPSTIRTTSMPTPTSQRLVPVNTMDDVHRLTTQHRAVVLFFTSVGCPPCRVIEPEFRRLVEAEPTTSPLGAGRIDMATGYSVAAQFGIRATPTFIFLLDGNKFSELKGAQPTALATELRTLVYATHPPAHPHWLHLRTPTLDGIGANPILFTQREGAQKALARCTTTSACVDLMASNPEYVDTWQTLQKLLEAGAATVSDTAAPLDKCLLITLLDRLHRQLPPSDQFALIDLVRYLLVTPQCKPSFESDDGLTLVRQLLYSTVQENGDSESSSKGLLVTTLRMACNLFSSNCMVEHIFPNPDAVASNPAVRGSEGHPACTMPLRDLITSLLVHTLLAEEPIVRQAAASLAFNLSA
ncbi:PPPDE putative peptidase domain-containing protein, partial [Dimargaris cristalligena]